MANIIQAGSESSDFPRVGTDLYGTNISSANYDAAFSRASIEVRESASNENYFYVDVASLDTAAAHVYLDAANTLTNSEGPTGIFRAQGTTGPIARIGPDLVTAGGLTLQLWNGSAWTIVDTIAPTALSTGAHYTFVVHVAVAGFIQFYHNDVLVGEYLGDTTVSGNITQMRFSSIRVNDIVYYSQVVVADARIIGCRYSTLQYSAAGAHAEWDGLVGNINTNTSPDTSFISTDVVGERATYVVGDLSAAAAALVPVAVVGCARQSKGETGPSRADILLRTAATDYVGAVDPLGAAGVFENRQHIWATNPNTAAAWSVAEINALEVGVQAIA